MLDFLIKNAAIITMNDACPLIKCGSIGIKGGIIQFVRDDALIKAESPENALTYSSAAEVIDARGKIIMPGLINTHAHVAMTTMRGYADDYMLKEWLFDKIFPVEGRLTEEAVLAGVNLGIAEMLASGTTSFSDMYFFEPSCARLIEKIGIRASLSNGVIALGDDYDFEADRAIIETRELIRDHHKSANGRIRADVSIHGEYTSRPDIWHKVSEMAREHDLITQIHLSETLDEQQGCIDRHGMTPAQILNKHGVFDTKTLAAHCIYVTDEDIDILAQKHVSVAHNPVSNLKLASGILDTAKLLKHGINVALGTDGCASNNTHDLFEEIKLASLLAKCINHDPTAIPAYQALKMATINGAIAQGREAEVGILKEGLQADFILIDTDKAHMHPIYDPISAVAYAAKGSDVCLTMVQGKILYRNGEWATIDIKQTMHDIEKIAMPIVINRNLI